MTNVRNRWSNHFFQRYYFRIDIRFPLLFSFIFVVNLQNKTIKFSAIHVSYCQIIDLHLCHQKIMQHHSNQQIIYQQIKRRILLSPMWKKTSWKGFLLWMVFRSWSQWFGSILSVLCAIPAKKSIFTHGIDHIYPQAWRYWIKSVGLHRSLFKHFMYDNELSIIWKR